MKLSIKDVACCLNLPITTVERWIRQGRIPIQKSSNGLKFNDTVLEKWAAAHNLPYKKLGEEHTRKSCLTLENLLPVMQRGGVFYHINGDDVPSVLKAAVENLPNLTEPVKSDLYKRLMEREQLTSTGIGKGVAIPHPHTPVSEFMDLSLIATCFLEKPLDFGAVDDKPVFVMFILISPTIKLHLHLLSRLSFCVRDNAFVEFLRAAPDPDAFFSKIAEFEKQLDKADHF
jgi:PTS system nitrogen regulatory IIA component